MRTLASVAVGAGVVAIGGAISWSLNEYRRPRQAFQLTYTKPGGTVAETPDRLAGDPTHFNVPATKYISFIAARCKLEHWTNTTNANASDVPEQAILRLPAETVSNHQFDCLASFVKPGYVTLTRTTY